MVTRLIFCAPYRIPSACLSLRFDHNLIGVTRNIIVCPVPTKVLFKILSSYGIDTNRFEHVHDGELLYCYPEINKWVIEGDYRGNWLMQQAMKLASLDYFKFKVALIHDPDTFMIQPYECIDNTKMMKMLALEDTDENSYKEVLPAVLGIDRQTSHCFVTELLPVDKTDFHLLKNKLENMHNTDFLSSIIDHVPATKTVDGTNQLKWFSEYEFLGNWTLTQRPVNYMFQSRFSFTKIDDLEHVDVTEYNSICDQSSGNDLALKFENWEDGKIVNFDRCLKILEQKQLL